MGNMIQACDPVWTLGAKHKVDGSQLNTKFPRMEEKNSMLCFTSDFHKMEEIYIPDFFNTS